MGESTPGFRTPPPLGLRLQIADADALIAIDPTFPLDEKVDRHGVVLVSAEKPVGPATIAAVAHWFGALGPRGEGPVLDVDPPGGAAPQRLHQDFPGGQRAAYSVFYAGVLQKPLPMTFVDLRRVCADLKGALRAWVVELQQGPGLPLVASHPRTGDPVLLPPPRRGGALDGVSAVQAASLIEELWAFIDASPHRIELEVRSNDLLVWDGLSVAYANPPLLHAEGARFLVAPADPAMSLARPDAG